MDFSHPSMSLIHTGDQLHTGRKVHIWARGTHRMNQTQGTLPLPPLQKKKEKKNYTVSMGFVPI